MFLNKPLDSELQFTKIDKQCWFKSTGKNVHRFST